MKNVFALEIIFEHFVNNQRRGRIDSGSMLFEHRSTLHVVKNKQKQFFRKGSRRTNVHCDGKLTPKAVYGPHRVPCNRNWLETSSTGCLVIRTNRCSSGSTALVVCNGDAALGTHISRPLSIIQLRRSVV